MCKIVNFQQENVNLELISKEEKKSFETKPTKFENKLQ